MIPFSRSASLARAQVRENQKQTNEIISCLFKDPKFKKAVEDALRRQEGVR